MGLKVKDLIQALSKFPQEWEVCMGEPYNDDNLGVKGIMSCSDVDEMGYCLYEFVEIRPMEHLDLDDLARGEVKMYGDSNWYNTKDTYEKYCTDGSRIKYCLTKDGRINILSCKNRNGDDITLCEVVDVNDDGEYWNIPIKEDTDNVRYALVDDGSIMRDTLTGDVLVRDKIVNRLNEQDELIEHLKTDCEYYQKELMDLVPQYVLMSREYL